MSAPTIDVRYVANLARLDLTNEEAERYGAQLEKVLGYVQKIESLDVDGIEPTAHAIPAFDALREDAERPSLDREAVLGNAPKRTEEEFVTPKVVEGA